MWKCPECNEEIDTLDYNVCTNGSEYGNAYLTNEKPTPDEEGDLNRNDIVVEHNYSDSGDTEWTDTPEYRCPECDEEIDPCNLIWISDDEKEEENKKKLEEEPEETQHQIIKPKNNILTSSKEMNVTDSTMICKMCFHIFLYEDNRYEMNDKKYKIHSCPQCFYENTMKEYKALLEKGYFNEKHKNRN